MASISTGESGQSGKRGKSLDAEINLVPFIDLLSMCICFLLMTAVWLQVGSLQVKQSHGTEGPAAANTSVDLELKFVNASHLELQVKRGGRAIKKMAVQAPSVQEMTPQLSGAVERLTAELKTQGLQVGAALITPQTGVSYGELVKAMDVLRKNKIANLGVVPVRTANGG